MSRLSHRLRRLCAVVLSAVPVLAAPGWGQSSKSYWLNYGTNVVGCEGVREGETLKAGVTNRTASLLINGLVDCRDTGSAYRFRFAFLNVAINPTQRGSIKREELNFDWLGLAVYRPAARGDAEIEWLYDEALPIQGRLAATGERKLVFGNLEFVVDKAVMSRATNMTFYLTAEGILYQFRFL